MQTFEFSEHTEAHTFRESFYDALFEQFIICLEYRYGARLLQKLITREEFESELTREIFRYAKRQMTWFKKNKEVHWLEVNNAKDSQKIVKEFLSV